MTLAVMMIVAIEQAVEAVAGVDEVEHRRFVERAAGADDFEAAGLSRMS